MMDFLTWLTQFQLLAMAVIVTVILVFIGFFSRGVGAVLDVVSVLGTMLIFTFISKYGYILYNGRSDNSQWINIMLAFIISPLFFLILRNAGSLLAARKLRVFVQKRGKKILGGVGISFIAGVVGLCGLFKISSVVKNADPKNDNTAIQELTETSLSLFNKAKVATQSTTDRFLGKFNQSKFPVDTEKKSSTTNFQKKLQNLFSFKKSDDTFTAQNNGIIVMLVITRMINEIPSENIAFAQLEERITEFNLLQDSNILDFIEQNDIDKFINYYTIQKFLGNWENKKIFDKLDFDSIIAQY